MQVFLWECQKTHHRGERREKTLELTYPHVGCRNHNHHGDVPLQRSSVHNFILNAITEIAAYCLFLRSLLSF
ncbi:MAG: hypothetical protein KIG84_00130 [Bacteroidales bacterium]|nr:hypothetical protein [Bacteroidales bacterium]